jgi:hypothetical protein
MLKQKTKVYSFEYDKVFESHDHTAALGWPTDCPGLRSMSDTAKKSMVGEGMSAPCIAACVYCYFLQPYAPWWRKKSAGTQGHSTDRATDRAPDDAGGCF